MTRESQRTAGILLVVLPTVMYGGATLLTMLTSDPRYIANPLRQDLWRAGHAHAGVVQKGDDSPRGDFDLPHNYSMSKTHEYRTTVTWDGAGDTGTSSYAAYGRNYRVLVEGKPDIEASADPVFRGDPSRHNPEDLFVASLSACHMLTYLALCARNNIHVIAYEDAATGTMETSVDGGGRFTEVVLHPTVEIARGDAALARTLHDKAHALCFIANSVSVPLRHEATIQEVTR
jgi:organic hydroperoxide reductase OsmC/OhrA